MKRNSRIPCIVQHALANLPAAERKAWQKLWADEEALLAKARAK
jgi:hypothetical protein